MKALLVFLAVVLGGCADMSHRPKHADQVNVILETTLGNIEIAVYTHQAPLSSHAFLALVDDGSFSHYGTFYRAVRKNENDRGHPTIDVIEGGWRDPAQLPPGIPHETTRETGLRHLDGTVSLARGKVGSATGASFFICIGAQPALDVGSIRNPDGQGFAAFGQVVHGMQVVRRIHQLRANPQADDPYLRGQLLYSPVRILHAYRKNQLAPAAG